MELFSEEEARNKAIQGYDDSTLDFHLEDSDDIDVDLNKDNNNNCFVEENK